MSSKKSIGPERVQQALDELGIPTQVTVLPESTRTAKEGGPGRGLPGGPDRQVHHLPGQGEQAAGPGGGLGA